MDDARTEHRGRGRPALRRSLAIGAAIGMGVLLTACGGTDRPASTTGAPGDVVQLTTPVAPQTIEPNPSVGRALVLQRRTAPER